MTARGKRNLRRLRLSVWGILAVGAIPAIPADYPNMHFHGFWGEPPWPFRVFAVLFLAALFIRAWREGRGGDRL